MAHEPRYELCLLSHGRQAAAAMWCHLNRHPRLFVPDFAYTDGLLLEDGAFAPQGPYASQLRVPSEVPELKLGLLVHLFSSLHRLPDAIRANLAKRLSPQPVFVLVARDPMANMRSMYRTYLELFFGRKAFGLRLEGHPLYDRENPLGLAEYVELSAFAVDYVAQLESLASAGSRRLVFDFRQLFGDSLRGVLDEIAASLELEPLAWEESFGSPSNAGAELIHQRLFSFRSRVELEGQRVDLGFFQRGADALLRGSYEVELNGSGLQGGEDVIAYASSASWFTLPIKTREWIVKGEGWRHVEAAWGRYRVYRAEVQERVQASLPLMEVGELPRARELLLDPGRRFRDLFPIVAGEWELGD